MTSDDQDGFTLVEISIVLVIVGLIAGGILVGSSMITGARIRSQITQIEKYRTATNVFRDKYGYLPGDLPPSAATKFGFNPTTRAGTQGRGDGNGILDCYGLSVVQNPSAGFGGETAMFWGDLTNARLIDGDFSADQSDALVPNAGTLPIPQMFPSGAFPGTFITVYSLSGRNYFTLGNLSAITYGYEYYSPVNLYASLSVQQAYAIDVKTDDGLPVSGNVMVGFPITYGYLSGAPGGSATSCFDSTAVQYSLAQSNGDGINCALSLKF